MTTGRRIERSSFLHRPFGRPHSPSAWSDCRRWIRATTRLRRRSWRRSRRARRRGRRQWRQWRSSSWCSPRPSYSPSRSPAGRTLHRQTLIKINENAQMNRFAWLVCVWYYEMWMEVILLGTQCYLLDLMYWKDVDLFRMWQFQAEWGNINIL